MEYYLFLDESGDHGLAKIDPEFPVFVLCGILINANEYDVMAGKVIDLKKSIWDDKKVILHSSDIRKCEKEFAVLFDEKIKKQFYEGLNGIIEESTFTIISAGVRKTDFNKEYGKIGNDVYQGCLSYIIERLVFCMNDINEETKVSIFIEKRGTKEDAWLAQHLQTILSRGTYYINPDQLRNIIRFKFYDKKENKVGLQIADLIAYPIARYIIDPQKPNPAFEIFVNKFYCRNEVRYGLKVFP